MSAAPSIAFCRERIAEHARLASAATDADRRRYHENAASSWTAELRFYEALDAARAYARHMVQS